MKQRLFLGGTSISLGLALVGLLMWLGGGGMVHAGSDVHCVNQTGTGCDVVCGGGCYSSVQSAIDGAGPGHEIRVAGGLYTDPAGTVAAISQELRVLGGFDSGCGIHSPGSHRTVFDAQEGGSVISVTNAGDVVLEFLTLTRGDGTGNCGSKGCGGGIYAVDTNLHVGHSVITDNVASKAGTMGMGGGIYARTGPSGLVEIWRSRIVSNTANADPSSTYYSYGGGVFVRNATTLLETSEIVRNAGSTAGVGGHGGGVYLYSVTHADVLTNTIRANEGSAHNFNGDGGGLFIFGSDAHVSGNLIEGNWTASNWAGYGGGIYISSQSQVHLSRNRIISNATAPAVSGWLAPGGGVYVSSGEPVLLSNNLIARNTASSAAGGGGVYVDRFAPAGTVRMVNNTVADNVNGGIQVGRNVAMTLTNNIIAGHTLGVTNTAPTSSTVWATTNLFWNDDDPIVGMGAIQQDPLLTTDYRLRGGSPAVNAAMAVPWLTVDLEGNRRPQGVAYDLGAFERPLGVQKEGPEAAYTDDVISYTLVVEHPGPIPLDGSLVLTDSLPSGVAFAGNLTATYGAAWYAPGEGAVYWENVATGPTATTMPAPAGQLTDGPVPAVSLSRPDSARAGSPEPGQGERAPMGLDNPLGASSDRVRLSSSATGGGTVSQAAAPLAPAAVLWDQPPSTVVTTAYANQDFEPSYDPMDIFIADDFVGDRPWAIRTLFVDGQTWNLGCDLSCASAVNWQIYADGGGTPDGDPWGGGNPPVWSTSLPPADPQVVFYTDTLGYETDVMLNLNVPVPLTGGTWWLVFYPSMSFDSCCQAGRHVADTTNGSPAHVINPGGGFGFPTGWTPVTDSSTWGLSTQDFAFRLEGDVGVVGPTAVTVTFDVTVTARPGEMVTNTVSLDDGAMVLRGTQAFQVPAPSGYTWEKDVTVNGAPYVDGPVEVGDEIQVVDRVVIDYDGWAASVLTETWDGSLELIDFDSNGGTVVPAPGALVWEGMGSDSAWLVLTKTFGVRDVPARKGVITETLTVESFAPEVRTLDFSWEDHHLYLPLILR